MGFEEPCLVPENAVRDFKCTWVFQVIKIGQSDNTIKFGLFCTGVDRTAIKQPITGRNRRGKEINVGVCISDY